ncbi:RnfH family protein [Paucibacter sediminis]|uniref:UPF0125 protein PFX98_16360 n=1 Tax=Paucibacter sediminis TaxID=3019553 RepID=A0AA95SJX7_9BURK|nr:RnfH family protein [Paucibacter sp. S2-9]WIT10478.1 RnfH family protein [Paucibacter sp. S2-9]
MGHAEGERFAVELVWSPARGDVRHCLLQLSAGTTLEQALRGCGELDAALLEQLPTLKIGIWGRLQALDTPLRPRDRIEIYRPLTVDPKEARRERYRAKGERIVSRHRPLAGKTSR